MLSPGGLPFPLQAPQGLMNSVFVKEAESKSKNYCLHGFQYLAFPGSHDAIAKQFLMHLSFSTVVQP